MSERAHKGGDRSGPRAEEPMLEPVSPPPAEDGTRLKLLEIAEKLFAEIGVENAPLQRIVEESGARNRSVLNYHFGSRSDLLGALLNMRSAQLNALRHVRLDEVEAAGLHGDAGAICRAAYQPMLDAISDEPWGASYIQVAAQSRFNPALATRRMIDYANSSGMRRAADLLAAALPEVPRTALLNRWIWATDVVINALARWCRNRQVLADMPGPVDDMFEFVSAGMAAPAQRHE